MERQSESKRKSDRISLNIRYVCGFNFLSSNFVYELNLNWMSKYNMLAAYVSVFELSFIFVEWDRVALVKCYIMHGIWWVAYEQEESVRER